MATKKTERDISSEKKKNDICRISMDLFRKHGYERTTIQDICTATDMSSGSIYHYFGSKEGILEYAIHDLDQYVIDLDKVEEKNNAPFETIMEFARAIASYWESLGPDLAAQLTLPYRKTQYTDDARFKGMPSTDSLKAYIGACQQVGTFSDELSSEDAAEFLLSIGRGQILDWCYFQGRYSLLDKVEWIYPHVLRSFLK